MRSATSRLQPKRWATHWRRTASTGTRLSRSCCSTGTRSNFCSGRLRWRGRHRPRDNGSGSRVGWPPRPAGLGRVLLQRTGHRLRASPSVERDWSWLCAPPNARINVRCQSRGDLLRAPAHQADGAGPWRRHSRPGAGVGEKKRAILPPSPPCPYTGATGARADRSAGSIEICAASPTGGSPLRLDGRGLGGQTHIEGGGHHAA